MREKILKLREEGKSYSEIVKEIGCSKSTIAYYCNKEYNKSARERMKENKKKNLIGTKVDSFKRLNKRLKIKSERFQHRDNSIKGKRAPFETSNIKFNSKDIIKMIEKHPYCYLTGVPLDLENPDGIALDHKIPASRGGTNTLDNLGICSKIANQSKYDLTIEEYIELCKKVLINFGYTVSKP